MVPPVSIMLPPSKLALVTAFLIWVISDLKSLFSAARSEVDSEVSDASSVLAFI